MTLKIYISIFLLFAGTSLFAQQPAPRVRKSPEQRAQNISKDLGISKEKAMELVMALQPIDTRIAALLADSLMNRKERHQQLMQLSKEKQAKLDTFLTPEQQQKMQAIIKARNAERLEQIKQRQEAVRKKVEAMRAARADSIRMKQSSKN
jgi:sensor histidine kinase regulating citrate/malate metabolism